MSKTVAKGDTGNTVLQVQSKLNQLGYDLSADGIFGRNTKAAVRHFQDVTGLQVDGIVGPNTHAMLDSYVNDGWSVEEWDVEEWHAEDEEEEESEEEDEEESEEEDE